MSDESLKRENLRRLPIDKTARNNDGPKRHLTVAQLLMVLKNFVAKIRLNVQKDGKKAQK